MTTCWWWSLKSESYSCFGVIPLISVSFVIDLSTNKCDSWEQVNQERKLKCKQNNKLYMCCNFRWAEFPTLVTLETVCCSKNICINSEFILIYLAIEWWLTKSKKKKVTNVQYRRESNPGSRVLSPLSSVSCPLRCREKLWIHMFTNKPFIFNGIGSCRLI